MLMAQKNHKVEYAKLILLEMTQNSLKFNWLCNKISEIQRLFKCRNKRPRHEKEVYLASIDEKKTFYQKCTNSGLVCRYKTKDYTKHKCRLQWSTTNTSVGN